MYTYNTTGTCSTKITFELKERKVVNIAFTDGCDGNLKAIAALAEGMETVKVISLLKGIKCGAKSTSCGDQLALAVEQVIEQQVIEQQVIEQQVIEQQVIEQQIVVQQTIQQQKSPKSTSVK